MADSNRRQGGSHVGENQEYEFAFSSHILLTTKVYFESH